MRVLVVEDEDKMRDVLRRGLERAGYAVDAVGHGADALSWARAHDYDAIVLDVVLPGIGGFEVCRRLRSQAVWTPVIMLSARDAVGDRVTGLDAGADDYLPKPFAFSELLGRLRALIRRGTGPRPAVLRCGALTVDPATRTVTYAAEPVALSGKEFALLELFARHPGQVLARSAIIGRVWDSSYDGGSNVVDVYVKSLRDKIDRRFGVELLQTVRGVGYRLVCPAS